MPAFATRTTIWEPTLTSWRVAVYSKAPRGIGDRTIVEQSIEIHIAGLEYAVGAVGGGDDNQAAAAVLQFVERMLVEKRRRDGERRRPRRRVGQADREDLGHPIP